MNSSQLYIGRFAPSPTGPLHFGSLLAAVASYLDARANQGRWLVRMDDLDQPRCVKGADSEILKTLEAYGLYWDGEVMYQSQRQAAYEAALDQLQQDKLVYACGCTRREIADIAHAGIEGPVYPGTCRPGLPAGKTARSIRLCTPDEIIVLQDRIQGEVKQHVQQQVGDFIIRRADGLFAYQLAVVVDDAEQHITDIVRGSDLLASTPRQISLQRLLGIKTPRYAHLPVAVNSVGNKLSKQTHAHPIDNRQARDTLLQVMRFLNQPVSNDMPQMSLHEFWAEAVARWQADKIPATLQLPSPME
ncbi:MAG: tRNA glutamyl-Q(34) synthetase GluQRS [Granulosicoccaceae bacterium]|jgi:glutamyl-Q tRNA(Asp) synthetase